MPAPGGSPGRSWLRRGWTLPALTGLLLGLSFPPGGLWPLPFVALVPLVMAVEGPGRAGPRTAARAGLVAGIVAWAILVYWVPLAVAPVTPVPVLFYVTLVLLLAMVVALFGWLLWWLRRAGGMPLWLAVPVAWTGTEWLRAHLGPFSFPWLELGVSLAGRPHLAAMAELVGARGLSFWIATVNGLAAAGLVATRGRRRRLLTWLAVVVTIPAAWGAWRVATLDTVPVARVAVFQPNLGRSTPATAGGGDTALARLGRLAARESLSGVDLAVWPEAMFTVDPRSDAGLTRAVQAVVDAIGAPVLFGAYLDEEAGDGNSVTYNGALVWRPGQGDIGYAYRKRRLVPGVETVPLMGHGGFAPGPRSGQSDAGDDLPRFAVLVCYESIFSDDARAAALAGADFLVNVTNDAWFGGEGGRSPTTGFQQHPAHLVLRAIELRLGAVRAANTGISLFVEPSGRVMEATPLFREDLRTATVHRVEGTTVFARVGDVVGWACAILCGGMLLLAFWRRGPSSDAMPLN